MLVILFLVLLVVICLLIQLDNIWKPKHGLILPKRIPLLGHILLFLGSSKQHQLLSAWASRLNDSSYSFHFLNQKFVIINSYEAIYEALVTKGKQLGGRVQSERFNSVLGADLAFSDISPQWQWLHHTVHCRLKQYGRGMKHIELLASDIANDLVTTLTKKAKTNKPFAPNADVRLAVMNVISSLLIGRKFLPDDAMCRQWHRLLLVFEEIGSFNSGIWLEAFPWLRRFGFLRTGKLMDEFVRSTTELTRCIKREYESGVADSQSGLVHELFALQEKENNGRRLNEEVIRTTMFLLMYAGIVTSANTMTAFLQIMSVHPEIQENLHAEIVETLKKTGKGEITLEDRSTMPYTQACLLEMFRYASVVPFGIPHRAMQDTTIQGLPVPKDTIVIPNLYHLHHNPKLWAAPRAFNPERFLDPAHGHLLPPDAPARRQLLAFGAGPRVCVGQSLAKARLFLFVTRLFQEFKVGMPGGVGAVGEDISVDAVGGDCRVGVGGGVVEGSWIGEGAGFGQGGAVGAVAAVGRVDEGGEVGEGVRMGAGGGVREGSGVKEGGGVAARNKVDSDSYSFQMILNPSEQELDFKLRLDNKK